MYISVFPSLDGQQSRPAQGDTTAVWLNDATFSWRSRDREPSTGGSGESRAKCEGDRGSEGEGGGGGGGGEKEDEREQKTAAVQWTLASVTLNIPPVSI